MTTNYQYEPGVHEVRKNESCSFATFQEQEQKYLSSKIKNHFMNNQKSTLATFGDNND